MHPIVLAEAQTVFSVQGVTAIPLSEDRARTVLDMLSAKLATAARPSLMPGLSVDSVLRARPGSLDELSLGDEATTVVEPSSEHDFTPRVTFADEDQIKVVTPLHSTQFDHDGDDDKDDSPPTPSSTTSTISEVSAKTGNVAKTLANRLSFWARPNKRTSVSAQSAARDEQDVLEASVKEERTAGDPASGNPDETSVPEPIAESDEQMPSDVLHSIVQDQGSTPLSQAAQHAELEKKIVREVVREYTSKGGMYFAYTFG
jgi:hypothetical protein